METLLVVLVLILFVLVFALRSRTKTLATELEKLRHNLGDQAAELNRVLELTEVRQTTVAGRLVGTAPAAARGPADEAVTVPPEAVPQPLHKDVLEPAHDLLHDAVPEVAVAAAVIGVAQQRRKQIEPSRFERWLKRVRTTDEWEALIGGRLLNRIGAVALILGMAFFLKYAVDQNWISQGLRVGLGILVGVGLLALASRSHQRGYAIFAQGLVGAGQAVLYLSVYASFNFYHLVPQSVALSAMGAITALAFVQAVSYDSLAVSLLACTGGYLTPFLLSSSNSGPVGTIIFVFLLDVGVLAVLSRKRSWTVLEPIALGATYVTYFSWYLASYSSDRMVPAAIALSLFWTLFLGFDVYDRLTSGAASPELRHILGVANGLAYYGALFALIGQEHRGWMSLLTLVIGAIYVAILFTVRRRNRLSTGVAARYTLTAIVLLVVATAIRFRGFPVVISWSLEALPLVWYGTRWKLWYVWRPALVVYALATGLLFATQGALAYQPIGSFRPLLNERALAYLVLAGTLAASIVPFRRLRRDRSDAIEQSLNYGWAGLIFILLAVETVDLFRRFMVGVSAESQTSLQFERSLAVAAVWIAFSLALGWFGLQKRMLSWLTVALGSAAAGIGLGAVVGIAYEPIQRYTPVINVRVGVFVLLIGGLALHLRWFTRDREAYLWIDHLRVGLQVVILLLGFELLSAEINDYFQHRFGHPLPSMDTGGAFIELAVLAAIWMAYSLLPTWYGVRKRTMPLISTGLSMGAAATGVAAFAGIVFQPSTQFATLLGVRPFVLAIVVAGLLIQLRWLRECQSLYRWTGHALVAIQAAIILLGFGLISAETRDAFAQRITGASGDSATTLRDLERLAFSLVWLAYAILVMGLGLWRRARWMRLGAMALFAGVILKVFIYDLSFLGAVYRPISFAGLGVILLAVSFLYQRYRSILLDPSYDDRS